MLNSKLPSLNSLRAFSLVARTGSFVSAAAHLNVTQAAVSQQVKALEGWLNVSLVQRSGRGVSLTTEGISLSRDLEVSFDLMQKSVNQILEKDAQRPVRITTSPAFASEWLMPRISEFQTLYPKITLMLNPTAEIMELDGFDLAIRNFDRRSTNISGTHFLFADNVIVGTPELLGQKEIVHPKMLINSPWLEELGTKNVEDWFQRHDVDVEKVISITQMPGSLIMQAVRRGAGITLTVRDYFDEDIKAGRIVAAYLEPKLGSFRIILGSENPSTSTKTFVKWLESVR